MRKRPIRLLLVGVILASACLSPAYTYNFENDFSKTDNTDNSLWSYRWKEGLTRDGVYPLLPLFRTDLWPSMPYFPVWTASERQTYPFIGVNDSGDAIHDPVIDPGAEWPWPNGQSNIHPLGDPNGLNALAVVSWLSPLNATLNIQLRFTDLDGRDGGGSDGIAYHIDNGNAAGNIISGSIPNGGDTGTIWITGVHVSVGDRLNFIIDPDANYYNDSTRMFIEITPEPTTFTLLGLGSLALVMGRRRK
jgi:hypothetical protein